MKKIILLATVAAIFSTAFISCKKESVTAPDTTALPLPIPADVTEGNAVAQLISEKNPSTGITSVYGERGITFKTTAKGNIKSFRIDAPTTGNKTVTLWKAGAIVAATTIKATTIGWNSSEEISIPITANTEYVLSILGTNFYSCSFSSGTFPVVKGNIILLNGCYIDGSHSYPSNITTSRLYGFVDFTFQKTP